MGGGAGFSQSSEGGYKKYVAKITAAGNGVDDPTVDIVSENSLGGDPVFTQTDTGNYLVTLAGAFPLTKTYLRLQGSPYFAVFVRNQNGASTVNRIEFGALDNANNFSDSLMSATDIEIRVYS